MATNLRVKILTDEEVRTVYHKAVNLLSHKGVRIDHPEALKVLSNAGANVNFDNYQVCFPEDMIETALRTVPESFVMAGMKESHDRMIPNPNKTFYVRTDTGNPNYLEETGTYRSTRLADLKEIGQLVEVLDQIDFCSFPFPKDVPQQTADIYGLKTFFENTSKHVILQPYSFESIKYLCELAQVVAGSSEALRKRPVMSMIACPLTPLTIERWCAEVIFQAAHYGLPLQASCLPSAGGTAPVTMAGTLLLYAVESLAIVVMSQIIKPGLPVTGVPLFFALDMVTGKIAMASIEASLGQAAGVQFTKTAYRIPTRTLGFGTDSPVPDQQAVIQKSFRALLIALAGSDTLCGAGGIDTSMVISPSQLIIDNTIAAMIKRIISGFLVNDDTLAEKEIFDTLPGGHFLELDHTLRHCRDALRPELFVSVAREIWSMEGAKDLFNRALDKYKELKMELKPQALPREVQSALDEIVESADKHLVR